MGGGRVERHLLAVAGAETGEAGRTELLPGEPKFRLGSPRGRAQGFEAGDWHGHICVSKGSLWPKHVLKQDTAEPGGLHEIITAIHGGVE